MMHDLGSGTPAYLAGVPNVVAIVNIAGARTLLNVPMLKEDELIGTITIFRQEVRPFTDKQIALVENFTKQAVIAIENTRLLRELRERTDDLSRIPPAADRDRRCAQGHQPLGVRSAAGARYAGRDPRVAVWWRRFHDLPAARTANFMSPPCLARYLPICSSCDPTQHPSISRARILARVAREKRTVHYPNVLDDPELSKGMTGLGGPRTLLGVPLLREGKPIGAITLRQSTLKPFTDKQIEVIETFADQAVIAIENVRLFDEVQAKTRDLTEALTYQTGSGNILSVIASSPTDVGPVLQAIVESACELCEAYDAVVRLKDGRRPGDQRASRPYAGSLRRWGTSPTSVSRARDYRSDAGACARRSFDEGADSRQRRNARRDGCRTILGVPLLREGESIGAIVLRRTEVHPFSDKQIELAADLRRSGRDRHRQCPAVRRGAGQDPRPYRVAATADRDRRRASGHQLVAGDLEPVFDKMLENATRICGAEFGSMNLTRTARCGRSHTTMCPPNMPPLEATVLTPHPTSPLAASIRDQAGGSRGRPADEPSLSRALSHGDRTGRARRRPHGRDRADARDDEVIGAITIYRNEVRPFSDKQIDLSSNFAKQAVIAIENARLLEGIAPTHR